MPLCLTSSILFHRSSQLVNVCNEKTAGRWYPKQKCWFTATPGSIQRIPLRKSALQAQLQDQEFTQRSNVGLNNSSAVESDEEGPIVRHSNKSQKDDEEYIVVAEITNTHGVRGEVRVRPMTDFPEERLEKAGRRFIQKGSNGPVEKVRLTRGRASVSRGHDVHILKFQGVNSPEEAKAKLVGCNLLVPASDRPGLDENEDGFEFYVQDLVGMLVIHKDGSNLGKVVDLFGGTGTYDVLQIELDTEEQKGCKVLVPFAREIAIDVDPENNTMVIDPPAGLLELAKAPKSKKRNKKRSSGKRTGRRDDVKRLQELREQKAETSSE